MYIFPRCFDNLFAISPNLVLVELPLIKISLEKIKFRISQYASDYTTRGYAVIICRVMGFILALIIGVLGILMIYYA